MKILKSSSKGFTLIELMVVISIIALLSSIVLASIKSARDRADNSRVVSELKSLQVALELHKNQLGVYPNTSNGDMVDEDELDTTGWTRPSFNNFVKTNLVDKKFLSKIIQSKGYPNNCINNNCMNGNTFFYVPPVVLYSDNNFYYSCGNQKLSRSNYVIGYITKDKLNLPEFTIYAYGDLQTGFYEDPVEFKTVNTYCLTV